MIRQFVIEDHIMMVVSSLRYLFRPNRDGIIVSGYASTVEDAIKSTDSGSFDLFVLDLYIPGHKPIDNIRNLKKHFPGKPIAIYTSEPSSSWKKRMMDEGALIYITKDASRDELKLALQKAAQGEVFYYGQFGSTEHKGLGDEPSSEKINITPVQHEIVKLLSEGLTHKEISDRSGISRSMIEKILKDLRTTFKANNNLELMKLLTLLGSI